MKSFTIYYANSFIINIIIIIIIIITIIIIISLFELG